MRKEDGQRFVMTTSQKRMQQLCADKWVTPILVCSFDRNSRIIMIRFIMYLSLYHVYNIGVQVHTFDQLIGTPKMSRSYLECSGHESHLNDCLVRHSTTSLQCSANRVGVICFPKSMNPLTDLPLCGMAVPSGMHLSTTAGIKGVHSLVTENIDTASRSTASLNIASSSISGLRLQYGSFNLILVGLVATVAMLYIRYIN